MVSSILNIEHCSQNKIVCERIYIYIYIYIYRFIYTYIYMYIYIYIYILHVVCNGEGIFVSKNGRTNDAYAFGLKIVVFAILLFVRILFDIIFCV